MQKSTSRKISYLQFIGALMVIAQHTVFASSFGVAEGTWLYRLHIWARDMNDGAVSAFFVLSGVLLMRTVKRLSWTQVMVRKLKTIALPYALWIVIYSLVHMVRGWLAAGAVTAPDVEALIRWIRTCPELYIFWFLRVLLAVTALYPVLMWCIRKRWPAAVLVAGLVVLNCWPNTPVPFESILYWLPAFMLGCWIGMDKMDWFDRNPGIRHWWTYAGVLALFLLLGWLRRVHIFFYYTFWTTGGLLLWMLAEPLQRLPNPPWWANASFFMYCCHMLIGNDMIALYQRIFGAGRKAFVLSHGLLPVMSGTVVLLIATLLRWLAPWLYSVLTGLRRPERSKKTAEG